MKIRDLLSMNKDFKRFKIIAGKEGLDRDIKDIDVLEIPDGVYWTKENEFNITTGYFFKDSPKDLVKLIEIQNDKKAAGMGIKLGRFIDTIPETAIKKANECKFPLILIPVDMGYSEIIWPVISYILGEIRYEDYLISEFKRELKNKTSNKYYLDDLIIMLTNYLNSDIYVLEKEKLTLISSNPNKKNYKKISLLIKNNSYLKKKKDIIIKEEDENIRIYKIHHHEITYGYLCLISNEFSPEKLKLEKLILKEIYTHIIIHILSFSKNKLESTKSIEEFFIKLLNNKYNAIDMHLKEDANFLRLNYFDKRIVLSIKIKNPPEIFNKRELTQFINKFFINEVKNLYVIDDINNIVIILTIEEFVKKDLIKLSKKIISKINLIQPDLKINIGISKECESLKHIPDAYNEAVYSHNIGSIKENNNIFFYDDYLVCHMISNISDNDIVKKLYRNIINKIKKESNNSEELIKTLRFLSKNDFNMKKTAEDLYIHRNTIYKRVNKIKKITGYDMNDSEKKLIFIMMSKLDEIIE